MTLPLCDNLLPGRRTCGHLKQFTQRHGRWTTICQRCAWREAGRCWQCSGPRTNHPVMGLYCDDCAKARTYAVNQRWHDLNADRVLAYHRRRWADGTVRRLRAAAKATRGPTR